MFIKCNNCTQAMRFEKMCVKKREYIANVRGLKDFVRLIIASILIFDINFLRP